MRTEALFSRITCLKDGRITLRRLTDEDHEGLCELTNDPVVYRFLPTYLYEQRYADKHYDIKGTNDDQLKVICDVCDLLVYVQSDVMKASLFSELKGKFKKASVWRTALADAARRLQEQKHRQAIQKSDELEGYRFYRRGHHYYDIDQQGRERDWTNFTIRPLFLIPDERNPTRIFELENESGIRKTIELKQMDVTKLDRFKDQIEGRGNFRFFEKQRLKNRSPGTTL